MKKIALKPFVKWAGGKGQLLDKLRSCYPKGLGTSINKYCEPFIGGGAVLFDILSNYHLDAVYISDVNKELINAYLVIQNNVDNLIYHLEELQSDYLPLQNEKRKEYYLTKRSAFNKVQLTKENLGNAEKAALFIFLNRTCFNGLFRVNTKGLFNVPMGAYKKPLICDAYNLRQISQVLHPAIIRWASYTESLSFIDKQTFVYIDPPYRPLTATSNFTAYNEAPFGDAEQVALAQFIGDIDALGAKIVASNSDPKNINPSDNFFDKLYSSFSINRVPAKRIINSNSAARSAINELLICNH